MDTKKILTFGAAGVAAAGMAIGGASLASAEGSAAGNSSHSAPSAEQPQEDGRSLSADAASKAIAAAQAKESGASVKGVHLDRDGDGYEVMLVRSDGTRVEAKVSDTFAVESVSEHTGRGPGGPGGPGERGPGGDRDSKGAAGEGGSKERAPKSGSSSSPSASTQAS